MFIHAIPIGWLYSFTTLSSAAAGNVCEAEMMNASKRYHIPLGILYAVGLTETGHKESLQPHALNINGKAVFAKTKTEAVRLFKDAKSRGVKLIDVGCMQINDYYHGSHFASIEEMLQPRKNVDYAARFLQILHQKEGNWTMAVARYHAGPNNNPAQKRYVCRVISNMVASGFGKWTSNSKIFCKDSSKKH
ncbi:transglycosylase SLT domain-containing protein [Bartonella bacilliformis]|uniref:transglycosylase SLT domain-containing protein n=1 Tax=Bartonella bacilliformis TaxID=774 RepID=UPI0005A42650|nr:transglycosylase SLT domain-containing protein [Bartonella bacilliformis]